ncbi:MAG: NHL repeat-containing protein [Acidobacteria bacterium]|nr:NHL repeat-containing protein [Acidobacteriota bacterium]
MTETVLKRVSLRKNIEEKTSVVHPSPLGLRPLTWLGARSPFGIALPDAKPSASQLYAPRGVFFDDDYLVAADSGNHRILIWHGVPDEDATPADIVLGQPDFESEGPKAGGRSVERGLHLPTGVRVIDGRLFVADSWHHRILVWNRMPTGNFQEPDYAIGQANLSEITENRGRERCAADSLYWCYGFNYINGIFYVADTGNRRVLGWRGIPEANQPADFVVGQDDFETNLENRGLDQTVDAKSFRWIHDIAGNEEIVYFADAGNHRVLGWTGALDADRDATLVLGQENFEKNGEFPYIKQGASRLRFPYSVSIDKDLVAVADTANNRVLFWKGLPKAGAYRPADAVAGQPNFDETGENRWKLVDRDTLCWVYGIHLYDGRLAIADSGNNRVTLWKVDEI